VGTRDSLSGGKRPGREADHSSQSSAEVKRTRGDIPPLPNTPSWCGAPLKRSTGTALPLVLL